MKEESDYIVEFRGLKKSFGSQTVLSGIDLQIPRGKITFVIGQSGEGKSVTLKHIIGILQPDEGSVFIDGKNMSSSTSEEWIQVRQKVGILFQDGALFDSLTVFENVVFPIREFRTVSESDLVTECARLLQLVGLPGKEDAFPSELSIGEKKRVGLARALALSPSILLYDEPTTSMDPLVSELIDELIISTQKKIPGLSSVVVSHDVGSILEVPDHIILLVQGKVYLAGPTQVFKSTTDPLVLQFLQGSREGPLTLQR